MVQIVFIELLPEVTNSGMYPPMPRHGAVQAASAAKKAGHDVTYLFEALVSDIEKRIDDIRPEYVAFTSITSTYPRVERMARRINAVTAIGGEHVNTFNTPIKYFDHIYRENDAHALAHQVTDTWQHFGKHEGPISNEYSIIENVGKKFMRLPLQTSKGCPSKCSFCVTPYLWKGYEERHHDFVRTDIRKGLQSGVKNFMIVDNNFGIGESSSLLEKIINDDFGVRFSTLMHADTITDKMAKLLRKAGFENISIGIESFSDSTIAEYKKSNTNVIRAVDSLKEQGISILGLFAVGSNYDTLEDVKRIPQIANCLGIDRIQVYALTVIPMPISPSLQGIYNEYKNQIIPGVPLEYYNGHFVTHRPRHMSALELQLAIADAHREFYSVPKVTKSIIKGPREFARKAATAYVIRNVDKQAHIKREINGMEQSYVNFLRETIG